MVSTRWLEDLGRGPALWVRAARVLGQITVVIAFASPAACGQKEDSLGDDAEAGGGASTSTGSGLRGCDALGIAACEEYIRLYASCIRDKFSEEYQGSALAALEATCEGWAATAEDPDNHELLTQTCIRATESIAASCES